MTLKALITGAAGFIGSTLADTLLSQGNDVVGVDCFTPYYDETRKRRNIEAASAHPSFTFTEADLRTADIDVLLDGIDVVFHQAAQPGVRLSWSDGFSQYTELNVLATQRLLEAAARSNIRRLVYASSSSVYGNAARYPTSETVIPAPHSPYGVTKLAAEHLCNLYAANWGVPTVSLRYFTVYGPRQRPDMAMHRLVEAAITSQPFPLHGDGTQVRDFTYVGDVVRANIAAAEVDSEPGAVFNVAGGGSITMNDLIELVGRVAGAPVRIDRRPAQAGDVDRTGGTTDLAARELSWKPEVDIEAGVRAHHDWMLRDHELETAVR